MVDITVFQDSNGWWKTAGPLSRSTDAGRSLHDVMEILAQRRGSAVVKVESPHGEWTTNLAEIRADYGQDYVEPSQVDFDDEYDPFYDIV